MAAFRDWRAERRALFKTVRRTVLKARVPSENSSTKVRSMSGVAVKKKGSGKKTPLPFLIGALKGTRTPDPLLRRQMLYPAELQAHNRYTFKCLNIIYATGVFVKYILAICRRKYSIMAAKPKRRFIALFIKILC